MTQKKSLEERIEAIKREEREDASAYYEQGEAAGHSAEEVPTEPIDKKQETIGLLTTITIVTLSVAGLALVLSFYFISDLETRVSGMDASISKASETIEASVAKLDKDLKTLDEKVNSVLNKLEELSALPPARQTTEEPDEEAEEESEEGDEEASGEEQDEEIAEESGESDEETSGEEQDEEVAEESEENDEEASVEVESDVIPALAPADESSSASHAEEIPQAVSLQQEVDEIEEELPSVEELN